MSQAQDLPVYRAAERLLNQEILMLQHFSRFFRYTIGERIVNITMDIMELIVDANQKRGEERRQVLLIVRGRHVVLTTLFRSCVTHRQLSRDQYVVYAELLENLGKQITGWVNSSPPKSPRRGRLSENYSVANILNI